MLAAEHLSLDIFAMEDTQLIGLYDEVNAVVYGMSKGGILDIGKHSYGEWMPDAFHDFDRYIEELDNIHKQFRLENGRNRYKIPLGESSQQGGKETLTRYREALRGQREDTRIMEREFARLARVLETRARRSGKKDVEISDPRDALKAQANALNWRFLVKSDEIAIPNLCTCCIEKIVHFDYYI